MHTCFFLINRSPYAMQKRFFQYKRFASATHIASFHIGNIPYAPGTAISFGRGLENPADLRFIFGRELENLIRIRLRFVRGMKNPAGIGFRFIRGIENPGGFEIRFYSMNERIAIFSDTRVGRNSIRPTNGHANGQMNGEMDRISVHFYPMNQKSDWDWIHLASDVAVCGVYAVAPYTGTRKNGDFSICSTTAVVVCGAYAIRPYPTGQKFIGVLVRFYPGNQKSDRN